MQRIAVRALIAMAVMSAQASVWGQWFDPSCCAQPQCCALPMQGCSGGSCGGSACGQSACVAQLPPQQCFQTIPVTEMRECKQIVQRPVCETTYVDQPVTEYRQVCETKTCQVPTVHYQTVTEYQTVQRDMGHWVTNYQCNPRLSPCQYDCRPDLFGFLNRAGYQARMAMTPRMTASRTWCPNVVAQQVPICRQVAVRNVQTVNYQVSRMVPYTTSRRVAVNTVRMVAQEIVTRHPVTVFRTVPMGGTATACAPNAPYGGPVGSIGGADTRNSYGTANNLQPTPVEPRGGGTATAILPKGPVNKPGPLNNLNNNSPADPLGPGGIGGGDDMPKPNRPGPPGASLAPNVDSNEEFVANRPVQVEARRPVAPFASTNSAARVGRWVASRSRTAPIAKTKASAVTVVEVSK